MLNRAISEELPDVPFYYNLNVIKYVLKNIIRLYFILTKILNNLLGVMFNSFIKRYTNERV